MLVVVVTVIQTGGSAPLEGGGWQCSLQPGLGLLLLPHSGANFRSMCLHPLLYSGPTLGTYAWHPLVYCGPTLVEYVWHPLFTACLVQGRVPLTARVKKFIFKQLKKLPSVRKQVGPSCNQRTGYFHCIGH